MEKRLRFGVIVSVAWGAMMIALLLVKLPNIVELGLNEWGDFFAGAFAPLAFFWLVLGYMQQGEELRLNTIALRLQVEELKNSVEQQRELVSVTRMQVESEREVIEYERRVREAELRPEFELRWGGGTFRGDGHCTYVLTLINAGHVALSVSLEVLFADGRVVSLLETPMIDRGTSTRLSLEMEQPLSGTDTKVVLKYRDAVKLHREQIFILSRDEEKPHSPLVARMVASKILGEQ